MNITHKTALHPEIDKELHKKMVAYFLGASMVDRKQLSKYIPKKEAEYMLSTLETAEVRGKTEGKTEGKAEGKIEDAQGMLGKGYPLQDVIEITGLSKEQLKKAGLINE